jgi:predicted aspartyl protease
MTTSFDPMDRMILVSVLIRGPKGRTVARLALDTGATSTLINPSLLVLVGIDPFASDERIPITTGSGVEYVSRVTIDRVESLRQTRERFPVVCHMLPPSAGVDGLLGLDFFRGTKLTIDFRLGQITLD